MRALVTGGAGFLGSHLVDALVGRGDQVVVFDNLKRGRLSHVQRAREIGTVELVTDDIRDFERVLRASEGVDIVYHLAAQSNVMGALQDVDYSFETNVVGTFNVLKAAAQAGIRRVVFSSSREVYGEPDELPVRESAPLAAKNPYGASKVAAEAYCRVWQRISGLECVVLRFANVYGPRDRDRVIPLWLDRARNGRDLDLYGGDQVLDFIWIGDAVAAMLAATSRAIDAPINVGSGVGTRLPDLAQRILKLTASRSRLHRLAARDAEVVRFVADVARMRSILEVEPSAEPLSGLPALAGEAAAAQV